MFTFQFSPVGILWRTVLLGIIISTPIPVTATVLSPQSQADFQPAEFAQSTADLELSRQQTKASHPKFIDLSIQLVTAYQTVGNYDQAYKILQDTLSRAQSIAPEKKYC